MSNKQKLFLIALFSVTTMITVIGFTFAYWTWTAPAASQTTIVFTTTSDLSCSLDGGGEITAQNLAPADCTNETYALKRKVSTNTTAVRDSLINMDIWLEVDTIGTGLQNSDNFKYAFTTSAGSCMDGE